MLVFRAALVALVLAGTPLTVRGEEPGRARAFLFHYETTITGLAPEQRARVWLPLPPTNAEQRATLVEEHAPAESRRTREPKYGNEMLFFEAAPDPDGRVRIAVTYRVHRRELGAEAGPPLDPALLLGPDARVPVGGAPLRLLQNRVLPDGSTPRARVLYDIVLDHMTYSKEGEGWGRGDAAWACESRFGNCTDFHSLFISLARSQRLPAIFEIGFPLPVERGAGTIDGYHCWAKVRVDDGRWLPVDISEADKDPTLTEYYFGRLTENRVLFSVGRDIDLVPQQAAEPLNFFIYPHVEVGGQAHPPEHVQRSFRYQDATPEHHPQPDPQEAP